MMYVVISFLAGMLVLWLLNVAMKGLIEKRYRRESEALRVVQNCIITGRRASRRSERLITPHYARRYVSRVLECPFPKAGGR